MPLHPVPERTTETGKVTVARIHAGLPGWGTYAVLYATSVTDGRVTATLAAADPADLDPQLDLTPARPYGNTAGEQRSLWTWAEAAEAPKGANESQPAYERRLATYLARTGHAARLSPASLSLKRATWDIDVEQDLPLTAPNGSAGYAGHHHLRIGRLTNLVVKAD